MRSRPFAALYLALCLSAAGAGVASEAAVEAARAHRQAHGAAILEEFRELLALPNVASDAEGIGRNAEWIREALARRGLAAEVWSVEGAPPVVYGRLEVPGAGRTLGIYAHYDGQPVDSAEWTNPPWTPVLYSAALEAGGERLAWPGPGQPIDPEWRIYARSAGDDKAPVAALLAALDALRAAGIAPTSNLRLLFEGEEEAGSDHLGTYLEEHRSALDADLWLICDGPVHQSRRPQLVFGVRGYAGLDLTVYGATRYLHSGHYGNWAPNPAEELARLLAGLEDGNGRVLVAGFYDRMAPVGEAERRALDELPAIDEALRRELGLAATEAGSAPLAERLLLPSLNVRGMASGAVGEAARNVIPTEATASLDLRLVQGNDPVAMQERVEAHLRGRGYHLVREAPDLETRLRHPRIVRVTRRGGYPATRTPIGLPVVRPVIDAAELAAGEPVVLLPTMGGSLPLYLFTSILESPLVIVPIANHDDNQHAPDENLRLANLWFGIDLMAVLLALPADSAAPRAGDGEN